MNHNNQSQNNFILQIQNQIQLSLRMDDNIRFLGFNHKSSILVLGTKNGIILIFQFKFGALKFIQQLNGLNTKQQFILFTKKSNQFIFVNNKIKILSQIGISKGSSQLQIDGPKPNCLVINNNDNLLISGCYDRAIRFWRNHQNQWIFHQKLQICYYGVIISLSLNESENYLICLSEFENKIFVCQQNTYTELWSLYQTLYCSESQALQLCFIRDSIFILQLYKGENFQFYCFNQENQQFELFIPKILEEQSNKLKISHRFQLQTIKQKQVLIYRKDNCLNLLKFVREKNFEFQNLITLNDESFIFRSTEEGNFIIIWQEYQKNLILLKLQEN